MKNSNIFFLFIILSYLKPLLIIKNKFQSNISLSSIICCNEFNKIVFDYLSLMIFCLLVYEINRNNFYSLLVMITFSIGCLKMLCYNESNIKHILYASLTFISLLIFMIIHNNKNSLLSILLYIQIILFFILLYNLKIKTTIIMIESLVLINFGIYFSVLHFIDK